LNLMELSIIPSLVDGDSPHCDVYNTYVTRQNLCTYTGLFKMIVGVSKLAIHNTLEIAVYVFFYLIEQHSQFL